MGIEEQAILERERAKLLRQIQQFNANAKKYIPEEDLDIMAGSILYGDNSFEAPWDIDPDAGGLDDNDPATNVIALPSTLSLTGELRNVQALREGELELRRGQANEVLATIRQIVGQLSFQWVKGV